MALQQSHVPLLSFQSNRVLGLIPSLSNLDDKSQFTIDGELFTVFLKKTGTMVNGEYPQFYAIKVSMRIEKAGSYKHHPDFVSLEAVQDSRTFSSGSIMPNQLREFFNLATSTIQTSPKVV